MIAAPLAGCAENGDDTPATSTPAGTTPTPTPVATPTPGVSGTAKAEDFESATVGGIPAGWTVVAGNWSVVENATGPKGSKVLLSDRTELGETTILDDAAGSWSDLEARVMFNVLAGEKGQAGGIIFRYEDAKNYYVVRYNENELSWNLFRTIDGDRQKFEPAATAATFQGGLHKWHELRLVATGPHISVFSGALLVIDYVETDADAPSSGKLGLWTRYDSKTQFDDFSVKAVGATTPTPPTTPVSTGVTGTPRRDDFENATAGSLPPGWSVATGNWTVRTNASAPAGSKVLASPSTSLNETAILNDAAGTWGDLEARVMFNVLGGEKGQAGGIVFRYKDAKNYYVVRYNHNELAWNLFRTIDGNRQKFEPTAGATEFQGALNKWTELRLEARGAHIQVYSGDLKVIDHMETDANAPTAGKIGLWTRYDSHTEFDDFSVAAN